MSERTFALIATAGLGVLVCWVLVSGFRRGEIEWPTPLVTYSGRRKDQPVRFWALAGCLTIFAAALVLLTAGQIYAALTR